MQNTNINKMDSVKEEAVRAYTGMSVVVPHRSEEKPLNISELTQNFNGCYATNNSTVCFVTDNEVFVAPYTRRLMSALRSNDFREACFYVPFSNGDFPKNEQLKWNLLREKARQLYAEDFVADCIAYCDEHHIGTISEETLKNCFEMPVTGVKVKHPNFESCYYPIVNSMYLDCSTIDRIGHFCTNNGKVVFVYRTGKTYVTKGYEILKELRAEGYTESDLFVPFSNGEQIQNPVLNARWESITE